MECQFAMDDKCEKLRMKEATHELEVKKCLLKDMENWQENKLLM